jgi:hypothetical protein
MPSGTAALAWPAPRQLSRDGLYVQRPVLDETSAVVVGGPGYIHGVVAPGYRRGDPGERPRVTAEVWVEKLDAIPIRLTRFPVNIAANGRPDDSCRWLLDHAPRAERDGQIAVGIEIDG